jgi:hypothetical protein
MRHVINPLIWSKRLRLLQSVQLHRNW